MSHALILADIEGIVDIRDFMNEVESSKTIYTREVEEYIKALRNNGVKRITVCDTHNAGTMIQPTILSKDVNLVSKLQNIRFDNDCYDFAVMVGLHGMSETPGIFPHTLRFDFRHLYVKDKPIGEVELYCRWLGAHGIPVILVTGDREAAYEANCFNPYRIACCNKSLSQNVLVETKLLYQKLAKHVDIAMSLDFSKCLSLDDDEIKVEFYNLDTVGALAQLGYTSKGERLVFESSVDLMKNIPALINDLNKVGGDFVNANVSFLSEIRQHAKNVSKESIERTGILSLLNKSVITLDSKSRNEILEVFYELSNRTT